MFDKIIFLSDGVAISEDLPGEPGSIISQRLKDND